MRSKITLPIIYAVVGVLVVWAELHRRSVTGQSLAPKIPDWFDSLMDLSVYRIWLVTLHASSVCTITGLLIGLFGGRASRVAFHSIFLGIVTACLVELSSLSSLSSSAQINAAILPQDFAELIVGYPLHTLIMAAFGFGVTRIIDWTHTTALQKYYPGDNQLKGTEDVSGLSVGPTTRWKRTFKVVGVSVFGIALLIVLLFAYGRFTRYEQSRLSNKVELSQSEIGAFRTRLSRCWSPPPGINATSEVVVSLRVLLKPDGYLAQEPGLIEATSSPLASALAESAKRAVISCQPFTMLRSEHYEQWKEIHLDFNPKELLRN